MTFLKKENFMYHSCPTEGCQKKVLDLGNGLYRCEKCNRETPNYKWRLMLSVSKLCLRYSFIEWVIWLAGWVVSLRICCV